MIKREFGAGGFGVGSNMPLVYQTQPDSPLNGPSQGVRYNNAPRGFTIFNPEAGEP